ncbi:MAG: hypothetical protein IKX31_12100 [Muribaculaceae bacterium]|nr:hypothetical protein [Muribaculaceae bacterium]
MGIKKSVLKFTIFSCIIACFFIGCKKGEENKELVHIDSLILQKQYETALKKISAIDASNFTDSDKAYYSLLKTQADYKNYIVATTDSAINYAVDYYSNSTDKEKYIRSLIYQGCVNEELGNLEKAVNCYHKADDVADKDDLQNKAFAKMRLGLLYQNQIFEAKSLAVEKLKEAQQLYHLIGDKHYELGCLGELGGLYSNNPEKEDSALYYIETAIKLAKSENEEYLLFANLYSKALYYLNIKHDYSKSKQAAKDAVSLKEVIDHPRAHYCLAKSYLKLNDLDSAKIILRYAPPMSNDVDSISYLSLMSEIFKEEGNLKESFHYYDMAHLIADSIMNNSLNHRLREVEKKYDTQKVELKNERLSSELKTSLLTAAVIAIISLVLLLFAIRFRQKLKMKEMENELINADLASSLEDLNKMQKTLNQYDKKLSEIKQEYKNTIIASESQVSKLKSEIEDANRSIVLNEQERETLNRQILELEEKEKRSSEMKSVIREQINVVRELLNSSYERNPETFTKIFNSSMTLPNRFSKSNYYWSNLYLITNDFFDDILVKAQDMAGGKLNDDELFILALCCWGFPRQGIMICMKYKNLASVTNKKVKVARKLKVKNMEEFLTLYRDNKEIE